jgi:hypothetical protein
MSDDVKLVKAQREAFAVGYVHAEKRYVASARTIDIAREEAKLRYPLPTVTVPRVVQHGCLKYRVVDNTVVEWATVGREDWTRMPDVDGLLERCKKITFLLENPTETREVTE